MSKYFINQSQCSRHTIFPGVEIHTAAAEKMMLSDVTLTAGAVVEPHSHPHEQVGIVLEGRLHFFIGDEDRVLGPGEMYRIPGGVTHHVVAENGPARALDIFYPIREDYL